MKKMQYSEEEEFIIRGYSFLIVKISTHKREAEKGFGDNVPKLGMGWQPHRTSVPPNREAIKNKNQERSET